jgi:hypothetical protein
MLTWNPMRTPTAADEAAARVLTGMARRPRLIEPWQSRAQPDVGVASSDGTSSSLAMRPVALRSAFTTPSGTTKPSIRRASDVPLLRFEPGFPP